MFINHHTQNLHNTFSTHFVLRSKMKTNLLTSHCRALIVCFLAAGASPNRRRLRVHSKPPVRPAGSILIFSSSWSCSVTVHLLCGPAGTNWRLMSAGRLRNLHRLHVGAFRSTMFVQNVGFYNKRWPNPVQVMFLPPDYSWDCSCIETLRSFRRWCQDLFL